MKISAKILIAFFLLEIFVVACSTVPVTGRKQFNIIPDSEMLSMSYSQYDQFLKENKLSNNAEQTEMVKRIGHRIEGAVTKYLTELQFTDLLDGYDWEFNLVDDPSVNAWCMPGGKVVVYTGILPVTKNEAGLAVVMGHEIAHAIAEHGSERMSQELIRQMGGVALTVALQNKPQETQALWMAAYGMGSEIGIMLPFSRMHESEADHMGLIFMAMAGYNPEGAPLFWERMAGQGGQKPPEFLSTHPSDETRIKNLNAWMPEAVGYYEASKN